jgi:hypothetical protein
LNEDQSWGKDCVFGLAEQMVALEADCERVQESLDGPDGAVRGGDMVEQN